MMNNKLVFGVGINDSDYVIQIKETVGYRENGKQIQKEVWACIFYRTWKNMLMRCYSQAEHLRKPNYSSCSSVPEWHYFMTFRAWMEKQDWEGKQLDKDLLVPGNKIYGPDTCLFIDQKVNSFLTEGRVSRGEYPVGVSFHKYVKKYQAQCKDVLNNKVKFLGYYKTSEEAHQAWLCYKLEQAKILAAQQSDRRIAKALIERYENYNETN